MVSPIIGIDLGTTFSCAAIYRKERGAEIISDENGDRVIPSVVYFDPKTGEVLVGNNAIDEIPECPQNGLFDAKRILGRQYDDEYVSRFVKSNEIPFSLVRAENDKVGYKVTIAGKQIIKTPEEVSAEVLKYLKRAADMHLGCEVTEAVISIPAYFSNAQRKATRQAAKLAGFNVLKLISEPTAAAIHYVSDKEKDNANIVVFDFGGGTLDVSIIKIVDKQFEVKAVYGDTFLGGRNFDEILFNYFEKICLKNRKISESSKRLFLRRLQTVCVELKKKLSTKTEARKSIPSSFGGDEEIFLTISRDQFEELARDLFDRAFEILKVCLHDYGISKSEIDEVVLVGGSIRIPKIRGMLSDYFDSNIIKTNIHPDEAIAAGASLQAALIRDKSNDLERYKTLAVTPMSLGIEAGIHGHGYMDIFIPRNSPLPCKIKQERYTTENNQTDLRIGIYEGERSRIIHNNFLGEFIVTGLPPKKAGDVIYSIIFELDEDGVLSVMVTEESTGMSKKLVVTMGYFRLSDKKIRISLEDAIRNNQEDQLFTDFIVRRGQMELLCQQILYDIDQISSTTDKEFVKNNCKDFLAFCINLDSTDMESLESKYTEISKSIWSVLKDNNMLQLRSSSP